MPAVLRFTGAPRSLASRQLISRLALAACALLAAGVAAAQDRASATLQRLRDTGVVRIAHRLDALPFAYVDAGKRPIGYGIDMCNEVVARLKAEQKLPALRVEYVPVTAASRFETVRSGKADLECGFTVNNPERRGDTGYALPYFFAGPRILTKASSGIREFHELRGRRIVTAKGANAVPILRKQIDEGRLLNTQLIEVANYDIAFGMLAKGEADALVTIDNLLYAVRAAAPKPEEYIVTGNYLIVEAVAIMLRKDDPGFKAAVDRHLASMMLDGTAGRLYARWFTQPVPPNGVTVGIPLGTLLRDQFRWPTDRTGDEGVVPQK